MPGETKLTMDPSHCFCHSDDESTDMFLVETLGYGPSGVPGVKGSDIEEATGRNVIFGLNWSFTIDKNGKCKVPHNHTFLLQMTKFCKDILTSNPADNIPLQKRKFPNKGVDDFMKQYLNDPFHRVDFWSLEKLKWDDLSADRKRKIENTRRKNNPDWMPTADETFIPTVTKSCWKQATFVCTKNRRELLRKVLKDTVFERVKKLLSESCSLRDPSSLPMDAQPSVRSRSNVVRSHPIAEADDRKRRAIEPASRGDEASTRKKQPGESLLWICGHGGEGLDSFVEGLLNATMDFVLVKSENDGIFDEVGWIDDEHPPGTIIHISRVDEKRPLSYTTRPRDNIMQVMMELRKLKGYTAPQLSKAITLANADQLIDGNFIEGSCVIVPEMKEKKNGAMMHLKCRPGDSYILYAELILAASSSVTAAQIQEQNPVLEAGKSINILIRPEI